MTWITDDGGGAASTVNQSHSSGATTIFMLKELWKQAGWTVLSSSDGTTYNSSGDQISSASSGANGMDNNYAWFRIEDPGSVREYVFQRNTGNSYQWKIIYSASDGFTGGTANATTIPTANDQVGLARRSDAFQTMFPTSGSWVAHAAAQNAAHNGVYSWWCCGYWSSDEQLFMCCEAIDDDSTSDDNDPSIHYCSDDTSAYTIWVGTSLTSQTDCFVGWMRYGELDEEWQGLTAVYYVASSISLWPLASATNFITNPHDSLINVLPIHWIRHSNTGSIVGFKGRGKYFPWNPRALAFVYTDLFQDGSDYLMVWEDILLPGWPNGTAPVTS